MIDYKILRNSKFAGIIVMCCALCFVLGFILLVSLDGYSTNEISQSLYQYSVYTVYTQFGIFIFSILPMHLICSDYKEKNIIFYSTLGYSPYKYLLNKILSIFVYVTITNFILSLFVSIIYSDYRNMFLFFIKIENVSGFIIMVSSAIAFIFSNFIKAFCINFALWIIGIILATMSESFFIFSFYDATLQRHKNFEMVLSRKSMFDKSIVEELFYNFVVLTIIVFLIYLFKKGWKKNGI